MNKKTILLILLILCAGCIQQETEPERTETTVFREGELTIKTNKAEYVQGDQIIIILENNLKEEVYFASCEYLVLEREVWNRWETAKKKCTRNMIAHSLPPGESKEFQLESRNSAKNYLDHGRYRERFDIYFGCSDSDVSKCGSSKTYYSNEFRVERRKLPELEDILNLSLETDKRKYEFDETVRILIRVDSQKDIGDARLKLRGIRSSCYRIQSEKNVRIPAGQNSFDYEYRIPAADSNLTIDPGVYGINADLYYDGDFEGIRYDNEIVASARERIEVVEGD